MNVKIEKTENKIVATSEYHPDLPGCAKALGGRWIDKTWQFDLRDEQRVRELYKKIYGTNGDESAELVTLRVYANDEFCEYNGALYLCGRQIARAYGRDSGATLGAGVIINKGGFTSSGSMKNWKTTAQSETIFELRDVARALADQTINNLPAGITSIEIISTETVETKKEKLEKKLESLYAEIEAVKKEISEYINK